MKRERVAARRRRSGESGVRCVQKADNVNHKPNRRPHIPEAVSREVFVEAGYRCAACGIPFPVERAHIIPWCKTQDDSPENLICLCANCHERADNDWGEAALREFKRNPWVTRQYRSDAVADSETVVITIKLTLPTLFTCQKNPKCHLTHSTQSRPTPEASEHESCGVTYDYKFETGWTSVQVRQLGYEYLDTLPSSIVRSSTDSAGICRKPASPYTRSRMNYVLQIDSAHNVPFLFGDVGTSHILQCEEHSEILTLSIAQKNRIIQANAHSSVAPASVATHGVR